MTTPLLTVFRKELNEYFQGWTAVFIFTIYLCISLVTAFYFGDFINNDNYALISFFSFQPEILALIVPAVCMPLWTDEYRLGTIEFILSQPISYFELVMGKFLAALSFGTLMLLSTIPLSIFSSFYMPVSFAQIFCEYMGCFLLLSAFTALSCAVSSLSKLPLITYTASFFLLWLVMYADITLVIKNLLGINRLPAIDFKDHYQNFINGELSLASVLYFILLAGIGLLINTVALRNSQYK